VRGLLDYQHEIRQMLTDCPSCVTGSHLDHAQKELLCYITALDQTLPTLPPLEQTIIHLLFDRYLTEEEAAAHLGMPRSRLRKHLRDACDQLAGPLGLA
jgi:DNA-directed RNA polymerase specialized sigma24 family protein